MNIQQSQHLVPKHSLAVVGLIGAAALLCAGLTPARAKENTVAAHALPPSAAASQPCNCALMNHAIMTKGSNGNPGRQAAAPAAAPAPAPLVKAAAAPEPLNPAAN